MQYSPKLKKAMEDIKTILKENDIAGVVCLHTPGFSEYVNHLETSYSCAKVETDGVRLKLNSNELGIEKASQIASDTYNMITHLNEHLKSHSFMYNNAYLLLKDKFNGKEGRGYHSSHNHQNN